MKKLLVIFLLCFASFAYSQVYTPVIANYTISGKPIGYSQATPADGRSMFYDVTNFIYRPFQNPAEVISFLNLAKYRAGNVVYVVDSGGTLNGNGTYTNFHATFYMFMDGVLDANLVKLNWTSGGGSGTCATCFFTTTQLTDSSFKLNRPNGTSDTVVVDFITGVYISTLNNGLNLVGTNGQIGGPLVKNTVINGGGFDFAISGNTFQQGQGAAITSANVMTTGHDGNSFPVIGSTQINAITTTNWQSGSIISFTFTGTPLLRNNQVAPAGSAPLLLAGGQDYTAATNDVIFFLYDAVNGVWHETSRKLAGSVIPVTANNAISLSGSLLQWGGTLVKPTTVAGNLFPTFFSGGRVEMPMGLPILAAGDLVPGNDGIFFHITGTTQINAISTTSFQAGAEISFVFDNIVTVKNNTVGGLNTAPMLLAGRVDYTSAVGDYIGFKFDGVNWIETERKLSGSVSSITASNGLTLTGANITLGGNLTGNTTIAAGAFTLSVSESGVNPAINIFNSSSGLGAQIQATSGEGAVISSITGTAVDLDITPASTNSMVKVVNIFRSTSGTAANGMGGYIGYQLKDPSNSIIDAASAGVKWLNAGTHLAQYVLGVNNGTSVVDAMTVDPTGGVISLSTGLGFTSIVGGTGAFFIGTNAGLVSESPIVAGQFESTSGSTNTPTLVLDLGRQGINFTGAIGNGVMIQMSGKDNAQQNVVNAQIQSKFTDVTNAATKSALNFLVNDGTGGTPVLAFSVIGLAGSSETVLIQNIPSYANNAAALAGGLTAGMCYRNGDALQIVH